MLSPKAVAEAIGVSESSLRRWADDGKLRFSRTAGGHRRIPLNEAIRFVRATDTPVLRPDKLGLPGATSDTPSEDALFAALAAGDATGAAAALTGLYVGGQSIAGIFDGPLRDAMTRMGELWRHRAEGIMIEHRATEICIRAISLLRTLMPEPAPHAPFAVGCGPERDPYVLPSMMAATVFADAGFRDINLGPDTPIDTLEHGVRDSEARVAWLCVMAPSKNRSIGAMLRDYGQRLAELRCTLVAGGRQLQPGSASPHDNVHVIGSMGELHSFARGLADHSPRPA